jgi:hypothetical protein
MLLAGMGFTSVNEHEAHIVLRIVLGHGLENRRRESAIGSRKGAELDDDRTPVPVLGEPHTTAFTGIGQLRVRRRMAHPR